MKHIITSSLSIDEIANRIGKKKSPPLKWYESRNANFRKLFSKELHQVEPIFRGTLKDKTNLSLVYISPVPRMRGNYHPVVRIRTIEKSPTTRQVEIQAGASLADNIRIIVFALLFILFILKTIFDYTEGESSRGSLLTLFVLIFISLPFRFKNTIEKEAVSKIEEMLKINVPEPDSTPLKI